MSTLVTLFSCLILSSASARAFDHNFAHWASFLKSFVEVINGNQSRVDYVKARESSSALDQFLAEVEAVSESEYHSWTEPRRQAFLINAYNAEVVRRVLQKKITKSFKGSTGAFISVFDEPWFNLFGEVSSLNRIEKRLARSAFKTTLFVFALNHAAKGDPMLRAEPWRAETLKPQYEESVRIFLGDPERNQYVPSANAFEVSKIFDLHAEEFALDPHAGGSVKGFLTKYMSRQGSPIPADANIKYLPFDWSLNGK